MMRRPTTILLALAALSAPLEAQRATSVPTPTSYLGFEPGADRKLADWGQIVGYFGRLAQTSPRVKLDTLGRSTNGLPLVMATIGTPQNLRRLDAIRTLQAKLADPRGLSAAEEARIVATQPAVVLVQCSIHSNEIGASQMSMELAYRLATVDTLQRALDNVVVLVIPSPNPDGEQLVTEWYRKNLGTRWEGGPMPWLYNKYVGHDDNRDWYMITQRETRLVSDLLYRKWFPEVVYDVHQQGNEGTRIALPPYVDPIDPNVDPLLVREIGHIGAEMALALEERGKRGAGDGVTYDLWWHGGARSVPYRHNMVGLLTEAASVKIATPITQTMADLKGHPRGLPKYEARVNFPDPWPGGTWRLRDIVEYELITSEALVRMLSQQRAEYVKNFVSLGRKAVAAGAAGGPRAWVIPTDQDDPYATNAMVDALRAGGVEVGVACTPGAIGCKAKQLVVDMAQPYRAHAKDLLETQSYPKIERYPGGPIERPYDVTGWTLPLQMGVRAYPVDSLPTFNRVPAYPHDIGVDVGVRVPEGNVSCAFGPSRVLSTGCYVGLGTPANPLPQAYPAAGGAARTLTRLPRIALYKPWTANMDEGWTRWVLDQFRFPYVSVTDSSVRAGRLRDRFDVVLVPDMSLREARDGMRAADVPAEYAGGLGAAGLAELRTFAEAGGTVVLLDRASEIATSAMGVNVTRITPTQGTTDQDSTRGEALYAPGSILRLLVDNTNPVAYGMPDTAAAYFTNSTTFDVPAGSAARVIARYPARGADVLLSGYLSGADRIAGKAAVVDAPVGRGRAILFGFRPQYRGQSYGTFKMLFDALLDGGLTAAASDATRQ